jgi:hypothetical protein
MRRLFLVFLGFLVLVGTGAGVWAASEKAMALRQANGLVAFTPSEKFLAGNFMADETNPTFIFGPVQAFAASRKCPTTWLVEEEPKKSPAGPGSPDKPPESTVYLEEDCPNQVVYYVFMDQSNMNPQQWMEWRRHLHKSKADSMFASAKAKLDKACQDGCEVSAELRFIQKDGELLAKSPEKVLRVDLKFAPIYDLNQQKKISR